MNARATDVHFSDERLYVRLMDDREISVPLQWFPRLAHATPGQRANWQLIGRGVGLHWPDVDEDLLVEGLLDARDDVTITNVPETNANDAYLVDDFKGPASIVLSGPEEISQSIYHLKKKALAVAGWMESSGQEQIIPLVWVEPNGRDELRRIAKARHASSRELIPVATIWRSAIPRNSLKAQGIARLDINFMLGGGNKGHCSLWFLLPEYLDPLEQIYETGALAVCAEQPTQSSEPPAGFGIHLTGDQTRLAKILEHYRPTHNRPVRPIP